MSSDVTGLKRPAGDWRAVVLLTAALTLARLTTIFRTPLELYPDEAQYWLWSRTLDLGYYSKPPMVAWAVWASTAIGGDAEPWVRVAAPLFQAIATLAVFGVGRRLYGSAAGLAAAALYALMPGVQLSALVAATDAPLMAFLGLALLAYATVQSAQGRRRLLAAAGCGAALGLAFLSKYAAIYAVIGAGLHLALSPDARRAWSPAAIAATLGALAAVIAPNLIWNATHGFATVRHIGANASWDVERPHHFAQAGEFLGSQLGVFGPIPFVVLVVGVVLAVRRKAMAPADLLLLCFILPPLAIVTGQAFVSRANANWAAAAYVPGAVLAAAWLLRWRTKGWFTAALGTQAALAAALLVFAAEPRAADAVGLSSGFKRAKGWAATSERIIDQAIGAGHYEAIAVNNRMLFYALAYYGRDYFADPDAPKLTAWLLAATPQNQAEAEAPLTPQRGGRVLAVAYEGWKEREMKADFARTYGDEIISIGLDPRHKRRVRMFTGEGFRPAPRDPVTGLPTPP